MTRRLLLAVAATALLVPCAAMAAPQATLAEARIGGATIEFAPQVDFSRAVLTVSTPGGQVLRFEGVGTVPSFGLFDAKGQPHPDGAYRWELRLSPRMTPELRKELRAARARGEEGSVGDRVVSGAFAIAGGAFVDPGEREALGPTTEKAITPTTEADQVIPDDLIVQGSTCVGLDCVNNENFGFDTIRLKENNLRIHFDDTSTQVGFPANDWRIIANDSAGGGASKFSIEDSQSAKTPFTISAGAATNSIFADSTGRIGLRTSTPVLDLHINTSNTPSIRLEQNNSGGFTAQTWDIGANEANFFVRDVTGGSRLSFRIRPGAPTSSVDISADGDVGIGTASPDDRLHVQCNSSGKACVSVKNSNATGFSGLEGFDEAGVSSFFLGVDNSGNSTRINSVNSHPLLIMTNSNERIRFPSSGNFIQQVATGAVLNSIGQWVDGSSRQFKQDIEELSPSQAMAALAGLTPVTFAYKASPGEVQAGFIAEDVPELVAQRDRKGLSALEIVAVLTQVVKQQQVTIEQLETRLDELQGQQKQD